MTPEPAALEMLDVLEIEARICNGCLLINRTSMVQFSNSKKGEQGAYDEVLSFLVGEFSDYHVMWSGRTDDELGVEFYARKQ